MSWTERILGTALGIVLGVGVVVVFVFVFSERTVDAPSLSDRSQTTKADGSGQGGNGGAQSGRTLPQPPGLTGRPTPEATIRIIGGAPPASGPAQLHYRKGDEIVLRVVSDETLRLQALGLGAGLTAHAGDPVGWQFKASKTGDFPLVVATSHIDVATISVRPSGA